MIAVYLHHFGESRVKETGMLHLPWVFEADLTQTWKVLSSNIMVLVDELGSCKIEGA